MTIENECGNNYLGSLAPLNPVASYSRPELRQNICDNRREPVILNEVKKLVWAEHQILPKV
jgi:hypothetical protein